MGFCGALALVFIALKLIKAVDWPWMWVLEPVWIPVAVGLAVGVVWVVVTVADMRRGGKKRR
jgi:hypothetical protein